MPHQRPLTTSSEPSRAPSGQAPQPEQAKASPAGQKPPAQKPSLTIILARRDQQQQPAKRPPWWRPALIHWIGLVVLLVLTGGFLFGAPALKSGVQQQIFSFKVGDGGLFLLPTPTPTPIPPTPTPTSPPPSSTGSGDVIAIIQSVFGSYSDAAIAVARCESGLNPSAVNPTPIGGSHATGVFQILYPSTWNTTSQAGNSPYDAQANTLAAYEIFQRDGYNWHEWSCQP